MKFMLEVHHHHYITNPAFEKKLEEMFHVLINQGERIMSVITDAVAAMEASFAKVSTDLTALSNSITALQAQLAASGTLSQTDSDAVNKVVGEAAALATAADVAANPAPPAPAPAPAPAPGP